jgi:hypothetical protein
LKDVIVTIEDQELTFRQALSDVFYYLIEGGMTWPGISTAHLYSVVVEKEYQSISAKTILQAFDRLHERAQGAFPDQAPKRLRLLLANCFSTVMFNMLAPRFFGLDEAYQPEDQDRCRGLAEHYTELFFALL